MVPLATMYLLWTYEEKKVIFDVTEVKYLSVWRDFQQKKAAQSDFADQDLRAIIQPLHIYLDLPWHHSAFAAYWKWVTQSCSTDFKTDTHPA